MGQREAARTKVASSSAFLIAVHLEQLCLLGLSIPQEPLSLCISPHISSLKFKEKSWEKITQRKRLAFQQQESTPQQLEGEKTKC